ncbi:MAG: transcription antitermination protein NusB [Oscillatoriales cyanobacterium SM2_1_8]|nr:transcription antitermination protein NusB [Oscillatoriales cyanobacterium SM2_1_8]
MQVRHLARELALLAASQLPTQPQNLDKKTAEDMVLAAVRSLTEEGKELLATAGGELSRAGNTLLDGETKRDDPRMALAEVQALTREAIALAKTAVERVGLAVELPELLQAANHIPTLKFATGLLQTVAEYRAEIDEALSKSLIDWQLTRIAEVDRRILRLAIAEMFFLKPLTPVQIAIDEAVELAKRYSSEDGYRFVHGVLGKAVLSRQRKRT